MNPEPTPTPSGRLSEQERSRIYAAIDFWNDDIDDEGWADIERIVRAHAERAWDEGAQAARDEAGWFCSRSFNCAAIPEDHNPYRQEADRD